MKVVSQVEAGALAYTLYKEKSPIGGALVRGNRIEQLQVDAAWRQRGYGSYLLKELLRAGGGFDRTAPSLFIAPLPADEDTSAQALAKKYGFVRQGGVLVRRRVPDLTAVELTHRFLAQRLAPGGLYLDATCGNGHDTLFLCGLAGNEGRVIGLDVQQQAVDNTNALLTEQGFGSVGRAVRADHADLLNYAAPGTADCVVFNFGWLPGADHTVFSTQASSVPALQAALCALKPGGVLAAALYSGKTIGCDEKQAVLAWMKALPIAQYTVLVCSFANWADTAPLPCFVIKKS